MCVQYSSKVHASTYHLGLRPGTEVLEKAGGSHAFQNWNHNLLTDRSASEHSLKYSQHRQMD